MTYCEHSQENIQACQKSQIIAVFQLRVVILSCNHKGGLIKDRFFMLSELFRARIGDTVISYMLYRLGVALRMTVV